VNREERRNLSAGQTIYFTDYSGRQIRLTQERLAHLLRHPEMDGQITRVQETLLQPELVVSTVVNQDVFVYHRYYQTTPVTSKFLLVVVKQTTDDAFILTAFFSNRQKKGKIVWQK
jgi:hypothetical protein